MINLNMKIVNWQFLKRFYTELKGILLIEFDNNIRPYNEYPMP